MRKNASFIHKGHKGLRHIVFNLQFPKILRLPDLKSAAVFLVDARIKRKPVLDRSFRVLYDRCTKISFFDIFFSVLLRHDVLKHDFQDDDVS